MSHPSRVRGLKLMFKVGSRLSAWSHPSRVRGLKYDGDGFSPGGSEVAPLAGAWIEMIVASYSIEL